MHIDKFIKWADKNENIKALILTGSLAGKGYKDNLSDYDIAVFGNNFDFIKTDKWLYELENFWICIHDRFEFLGYHIPTRLVIFDEACKIDFSFYSVELINKIFKNEKLPDAYNIGYQILLDKDGLLLNIAAPAYTGFKLVKPSKEEFEKNINEFWFEVYHEAKYLNRKDLWTAKRRDNSAKEFLLQMLEWNEGAKLNWNFSPNNSGKGMKEWIDNEIWCKLHYCYGNFDVESSWQALENTIELYSDVANDTAHELSYNYNQKLEEKMLKFIKKIKKER